VRQYPARARARYPARGEVRVGRGLRTHPGPPWQNYVCDGTEYCVAITVACDYWWWRHWRAVDTGAVIPVGGRYWWWRSLAVENTGRGDTWRGYPGGETPGSSARGTVTIGMAAATAWSEDTGGKLGDTAPRVLCAIHSSAVNTGGDSAGPRIGLTSPRGVAEPRRLRRRHVARPRELQCSGESACYGDGAGARDHGGETGAGRQRLSGALPSMGARRLLQVLTSLWRKAAEQQWAWMYISRGSASPVRRCLRSKCRLTVAPHSRRIHTSAGKRC